MVRSHTPASRASTGTRAPLDAQLDPEVAAAQPADPAADPPARPSEGPAPAWASGAPPSDRAPASHAPLEPLGSSPSPCSPRPVRWDDPEDARAWLAAVRAHIADLVALAREGCRRGKGRVLSRAERGRQTRAAEHALGTLLDAADAGLLSLPAPRGEQGE
jgi:hypothetical protein